EFGKFRSVSPIAFLLLLMSVGFTAWNGPSDIGPRGLPVAYVHIHNHGSGDMLPGAPCLQSFQLVQRSQHRSGKRGFMPLEVFEWLCKHFQDPRDFERKIIELSPREK